MELQTTTQTPTFIPNVQMELQPTTAPLNLFAKLQGAQREIARIEKSARVNAGVKKYDYATLPVVLDAVEPALHNNDLVFSAVPDYSVHYALTDEIICVGVMHCSIFNIQTCEERKGSMPLYIREVTEKFADGNVKKGDDPMQKMGSAITYATRYCLLSMVGKAPGMDTDCNPASVVTHIEPKAKPAYTPKPSPVDVTPVQKAIAAEPEMKLSTHERSRITFEIHELYKLKEGVVRQQETTRSKQVIQLVKDDFIGAEDHALVNIKGWLAGI